MEIRDEAVGLAVGAGGPTGGPFIDAVLEVIESRTGWNRSNASRVVGTSAGAFVAARIRPAKTAIVAPEAVAALVSASNVSTMSVTMSTRVARGLRLVAGRALAALAPIGREQALYDVPGAPFHPGAHVVTVERRSGQRWCHNLENREAISTDLVRASAAIPFANGPIEIDGRFHVDGAVHSAANVDLLDPTETPVIVVIAPMVPATGGTLVGRFHRWQLFEELRPWSRRGRAAVVVMPSEQEHENRRDREFFRAAGTRAAERLFLDE